MKAVLAVLTVLAVFTAPATAGILDWIFPKHDIQVITVTDTTPVGALRRPASPANPVFYMAVSAGFRDFGGIVAGEKAPKKEEVFKTMGAVLAKQGYLPATEKNPPTLLLLWTWGTMNTDRIYSFNPDDTEGRQVNRRPSRKSVRYRQARERTPALFCKKITIPASHIITTMNCGTGQPTGFIYG